MLRCSPPIMALGSGNLCPRGDAEFTARALPVTFRFNLQVKI
jgi:hypothetical protein